MRPISNPDDDSVVVYPADSTFDGAWTIWDEDAPSPHEPNTVSIATNVTASVEVKYLDWDIKELLRDSKYASAFTGGQFMHAFLNTYDYHRQHAPVSGTVVEVNLIQGLCYMNVIAREDGRLVAQRSLASRGFSKRSLANGLVSELDAPDNAGYQFLQTRGLIIIDNPLLGKVAVLPIGMAQVSSVKLVWEPEEGGSYPIYPNATIKKGDEISHFEFGGSDVVLVFEKSANIKILGATGTDSQGEQTTKQKYLMGMPLGVSLNSY